MDILDQVAQVVPVKYQTAILGSGIILKWLAELYSSVVAGGGIKRILFSFIYGENVPKVIANDYKEELNTKVPVAPVTPPNP